MDRGGLRRWLLGHVGAHVPDRMDYLFTRRGDDRFLSGLDASNNHRNRFDTTAGICWGKPTRR